MGYPSVCYCVILPKPLLLLVRLLHYLMLAVSPVFIFLGLLSSAEIDTGFGYGGPPAAGELKNRLPVVRFGTLGIGEVNCAVCLRQLRLRDEVRELGACRHAFHLRCIDRWLDVGQVSCPLCRSRLWSPPCR